MRKLYYDYCSFKQWRLDLRYDGLQIALIISGVVIMIAGFMLHAFTPRIYFLYYWGPLAIRTIMPALAYGTTLLLVGMAYLKAEHKGSIIIVLTLLILWNSGFTFVIYDFLTTPYGPELAFEHYFFVVQTVTYPWIIANIAAILYLLHLFKRKRSLRSKR